ARHLLVGHVVVVERGEVRFQISAQAVELSLRFNNVLSRGHGFSLPIRFRFGLPASEPASHTLAVLALPGKNQRERIAGYVETLRNGQRILICWNRNERGFYQFLLDES